MNDDLERRYKLLHGDREAARAELRRIKASGKEVVAVSACLLGVRCRFDGQAKEHAAAVAKHAGGEVEILPICPEVLAGFGVPRPAITLSDDGKKAYDKKGREVTDTLEAGVRLADLFLQEGGAARAILKERSPSCGVRQVHGPEGVHEGEGRFTARVKKRLPVVSEED
jgi:uncharacterized protein YbbK (DUF523 family)